MYPTVLAGGDPYAPPLGMTVTTSLVGNCDGGSFVVPDGVYTIPWDGTYPTCGGTYTDSSGFMIIASINTNFNPPECVVVITDPDGNTIFDVAGDSPMLIGDTLTNGVADSTQPSGLCPGTCVLDV